MNREIKFRAWDEEVKEMLMPSDCLLRLDFKGDLYLSNKNRASSSIVLHQFTGLKDKNGKEIYEGDIMGGHPHGTAFVEWNSEYACFEAVSFTDEWDEDGETQRQVKNGGLLANDLKDCFDEWTVIGNIYENPDLLK